MIADSGSIAEKKRLRLLFRKRRMDMTDAEWSEQSAAVCKKLLIHPTLRTAQRIHSFWPIHEKREVDIRPVLKQWLSEGRTIWLPVVDGVTLAAGRLVEGIELKPGPFGVLEPDADPSFSWDAIDTAIVPALAVDDFGRRLGYGGGYYDRLLPGVHVPTLCPIFEWERVPSLPDEIHDIRVTHVVSA